jgi:hypothetical protein
MGQPVLLLMNDLPLLSSATDASLALHAGAHRTSVTANKIVLEWANRSACLLLIWHEACIFALPTAAGYS